MVMERTGGPGSGGEYVEPGPLSGDAEIGDPFWVRRLTGDGDDAAGYGEEEGDLRIIRLWGDSMEPQVRAGDRVVVDLACRQPAAGDTFLFREGGELVVRRVEALEGDDTPRLRLIPANPDYPHRECLARDARIIGKVAWVVQRV